MHGKVACTLFWFFPVWIPAHIIPVGGKVYTSSRKARISLSWTTSKDFKHDRDPKGTDTNIDGSNNLPRKARISPSWTTSREPATTKHSSVISSPFLLIKIRIIFSKEHIKKEIILSKEGQKGSWWWSLPGHSGSSWSLLPKLAGSLFNHIGVQHIYHMKPFTHQA